MHWRFILGSTLFGLGALITTLNFYLSFLRHPIHRLLKREYHWSSVLPLFGSVFLWIAAGQFPRGHVLRTTALILSLFDTGGIHWFAATMFVLWLWPSAVNSNREDNGKQ